MGLVMHGPGRNHAQGPVAGGWHSRWVHGAKISPWRQFVRRSSALGAPILSRTQVYYRFHIVCFLGFTFFAYVHYSGSWIYFTPGTGRGWQGTSVRFDPGRHGAACLPRLVRQAPRPRQSPPSLVMPTNPRAQA